jgi:hypothetical protein
MSTFELENIREEIMHTLRNADIFSTTIRGVTTVTDNITGIAGSTITPTHSTLKNIRSLTITAVNKYFIKDYMINFSTGVITLVSALSGGEAIVLNYDYGTGDKVYPDMPRSDLTLESFPRIGISLVSPSTEPLGLGGMVHITDYLISIYVWMPVNKVSTIAGGLGGGDDLNDTMSDVRNAIRANAKSFYSFPYITPTSGTPVTVGTNQKIIQISQDFLVKFMVE